MPVCSNACVSVNIFHAICTSKYSYTVDSSTYLRTGLSNWHMRSQGLVLELSDER